MARLLLVDDEPSHIKLWLLALAPSGHQIDIAENLSEAKEQLTSVAPDVLVMDLRMPELNDGLALIRHAGGRPSTRILVLSGWPQDLEPLPERKLVHSILAKPVKVPALLRAISDLSVPEPAG